jgi:GT2 family glycosyltransferase
VAWRQPALTLKTVASLLAMRPSVDKMCCVVQEWSEEECEALREMLPAGSIVIEHKDNLGYSECANQGVEAVLAWGASFVLLVNNDATVTENCLNVLLDEARRRPAAAAIGPAVVWAHDPDSIWYAGATHSHRLGITRHPGLRGSARALPPTALTDYIPGCCVLVSAKAWRDVGGYRDDYFLYYEDAEWCSRARAKGWECWYLGEVLCHHAGSVSAGAAGQVGRLNEIGAYYLARNPLRFALETSDSWLRFTRVLGVTILWGSYNVYRLSRSGSLQVWQAYLAGTIDAIRGRMGPRHQPIAS